MSDHDDLSAALRRLPAPEPGPQLFDRIVRSRALGRNRHIHLQERGFVFQWGWIAAACVAILFIGGSWMAAVKFAELGNSSAVREPLDELLRSTGMWPPNRESNEPRRTSHPMYRLITSDDLDVSRLVEGVWTYSLETTTDHILTQRNGDVAIRMARTSYAGRPAWMINTGRQRGPWDRFADTTYLDPTTLRPQQMVAFGNRGRTRVFQTFLADSGLESIEMTGPIERSWRGSVLLPFPRNVLFVSDWSISRLVPVLPAIPFARRWSGTLYQIAFISQAGIKSIAPVDLKVVGTDRVTVPAGVYDCWRVEIGSRFGDTERATLWISRDKGWLIQKQVRGGDFTVTTRLESYEPGS